MAGTLTPLTTDPVAIYRPQLEGKPILLFDGVCVFCNRTVQFLLRHDPQAVLRFVPLESPLGQQLLSRFDAAPGMEGVVLISNALTANETISRRSDASSGALQLLPQPWRTAGKVLNLVPRGLREFFYTLIVRHRYRLFGRYGTCPVPTPEQRSRILGIGPAPALTGL